MTHLTPKRTEIANTERLLRLAKRYASTGTIHDELIPFFNQDGQWDLVLWGWRKCLHKVICRHMENAYLPEERRIERCPDGWRLRTSFVWREVGTIQLPWAEVAGTVRILKTASVVAPKLRLVGSHVYVQCANLIDCPRLGEIIGDLCLYVTNSLNMQKLHYVGGNLRIAGENLPNLETVGGLARFKWIGYLFFLPCLRSVGGDLVANDVLCVSAPKLRWVGGDFETGEEIVSVRVPSLEHVGGSVWANHASSVNARRLKSIGGDLWTCNADNFHPRNIRIGGTWHISPVAEKQKITDERATEALRVDDPLSI